MSRVGANRHRLVLAVAGASARHTPGPGPGPCRHERGPPLPLCNRALPEAQSGRLPAPGAAIPGFPASTLLTRGSGGGVRGTGMTVSLGHGLASRSSRGCDPCCVDTACHFVGTHVAILEQNNLLKLFASFSKPPCPLRQPRGWDSGLGRHPRLEAAGVTVVVWGWGVASHTPSSSGFAS